MKTKNPTLKRVLEKYKKISTLGHIRAVLDYDMQVSMPPKASEERADQMTFLTAEVTKLWKNPDFVKDLEELSSRQDSLTDEEKAVIKNLEHSAKMFWKVPEELILENSKVTSEAHTVWAKAKKDNKFKDFLPYLKRIIEIQRLMATHLGYQKNPYDALLDQYEMGLTAAEVRGMFNTIRPTLTELTKKVTKSKKYPKHLQRLTDGSVKYPEEVQRQINIFILKKMGYDLEAGKMDTSAHPFTTQLGRDDVRLTTFYRESDLQDSFSAAMHECGHALYEQGVNRDYDNTPLQEGVSMGIHEAMSRFWENQVGKNPLFLRYMAPVFQAFYPEQLGKIPDEDLIMLFNLVTPSFVRVLADELTYTLHIIIRFEMEDGLINGKIKPEDAAKVWNQKYKQYLGITPKTDTEGILQDIHWAMGAFGYFPSYALGNLYACQVLNKMSKEINFNEALSKGELGTISYWLKDNLFKYGSLYWPADLIKVVTGEKLNPKYFLDYLNKKYKALYSL